MDRALAITTTGDDRDSALIAQGGSDEVRVVPPIGDHALDADGLAD